MPNRIGGIFMPAHGEVGRVEPILLRTVENGIADRIGKIVSMLIASALRTIAIAFYYYFGGWKNAVEQFTQKRAVLEGQNEKNK